MSLVWCFIIWHVFTAHIFETIVLLCMQIHWVCNMFIQESGQERFLCEHLQVSTGDLHTTINTFLHLFIF